MNTKITQIGTETDKLGHKVETYHSPSLAFSPVFTSFLRNYAEHIDSGFATPMTTWEDHYNVIYATIDGVIVGHMTYKEEHRDAPGLVWIIFDLVESDYRGRGIYKILFKQLEKVAKSLGKSGIAGLVHVDNNAKLSCHESIGAIPHFYLVAKTFGVDTQ